MLKLAETESTLWAEPQVLNGNWIAPKVEVTTLPSIPGRWCFKDGSWKENDIYSGEGWLSTLERFDGLLGRGMSGLVYLLFMRREKMVLEPKEWPIFASYLKDIKTLKERFLRSEIIYVPKTQNSKADSLARSAKKQPSFIVHMDQDLPV